MRLWLLSILLSLLVISAPAEPGIFQVFAIDCSRYRKGEEIFPGVGTATLIDKASGVFLTAAHVVNRAYAEAKERGMSNIFLRVSTPLEALFVPVTNIYSGFSGTNIEADQDFALIKLVRASDTNALDPWEEVKLSEVSLMNYCEVLKSFTNPFQVVGFPGGKTSFTRVPAGFATTSPIGQRCWRITAAAFGGDSGGPCFLGDQIVGIWITKEENQKGDNLQYAFSQVLSISDVLVEMASHVTMSDKVLTLLDVIKSALPGIDHQAAGFRYIALKPLERVQFIMAVCTNKVQPESLDLIAQLIQTEPSAKLSRRLFERCLPSYMKVSSVQGIKDAVARLDQGENVPMAVVCSAFADAKSLIEDPSGLPHSPGLTNAGPDQRALAQATAGYVYIKTKFRIGGISVGRSEVRVLKQAARLDRDNPQVLRSLALLPGSSSFKESCLALAAKQAIDSAGSVPKGIVYDYLRIDSKKMTEDAATKALIGLSGLEATKATVLKGISRPSN